MLEETQDTEEIIERVAALDIGKAEVVCCTRVPREGSPGRRMQEVVTYPTMTRSLLGMCDHLRCLGVTRVVMEATSDYWRPAFYLLEAAGFEVWLVNARDVKHLPGRPKTDKLDAVWLAKIAERQMIRPSFVPPREIRALRDLTRYRTDLVAARTSEKQRVEKLLEDAQIKVTTVATDIFGPSGRDMLAALIAGERDPKTLAQYARRRLRAKLAELEEAFTGHFTDHHAFLLTKMLGRIDAINADIAAIDARIGAEVAPYADAIARLSEIPGISPIAAHVIIAEIGLDMTRFPTAAHLASWAKFAPGVKESAGKKKGRGHHRPRQLLPGPRAGQLRHRRRKDRHLPRRALPAHRPSPRQEEGPGRGRPVAPGRHLAPALDPGHPLPRPGIRLLRHPHRPRPPQAQPHPPARSPRLHRHPRTRLTTETQSTRRHLAHGLMTRASRFLHFRMRRPTSKGPTANGGALRHRAR
ncbi:IS110 family transposase [Streptomyces mirabilis]|uniref:IS110 family transposase n=1 Tax=Streptomyces mirabilis TaxID=68239 RepID=UPI0033A7969F